MSGKDYKLFIPKNTAIRFDQRNIYSIYENFPGETKDSTEGRFYYNQ